jgi:hypothetical protein
MKEATWRGIWTVMLYEPFHVTSASARTVALVFGFCMLILINIYCASLTTFLTVSQLNTDISSVDDLRGKSVGTVSVYKPRLAKYGISGTSLDFQGISSAPDWVAALRNGSLAATTVDEPFQRYVAATSGCDLRILRDTFEPFDYGVAFRVGTPEDEVARVSSAVLGLQGDGTLTALRTEFIAIENACGELASDNDAAAISFSQMWGLWVILGAAAGLSLVVLGLSMWQTKRRRQRYQAAEAAAGHRGHGHGKPDTAVDVMAAAKSSMQAATAAHLTSSPTNGVVPANGTKSALDSVTPFGAGTDTKLASIAAMVEGIRVLCLEHEALQKAYAELAAKHARYAGYEDDDGDRVVDEALGEVPLEEDTDFESVYSDSIHSTM